MQKNLITIVILPIMALYTMLPCITEAQDILPLNVSVTRIGINKVGTDLRNSPNVIENSISTTQSITYYYSGSTILNEADDNGDMSTYLGSSIRTIFDTKDKSIIQSGFLISDGENIIAQTDDTGTNINNTQQYTPYGVPTSSLNTLNIKLKTSADILNICQNPFQYDGYYYDQESGLDYLQARYYNPTLMHFISMDTYDLANRYAYCNANPIGNMDPTGHISSELENICNFTLNTISSLEDIRTFLQTLAFTKEGFAMTSPQLLLGGALIAGITGLILTSISQSLSQKDEKTKNILSYMGSVMTGVNILAGSYGKIRLSKLKPYDDFNYSGHIKRQWRNGDSSKLLLDANKKNSYTISDHNAINDFIVSNPNYNMSTLKAHQPKIYQSLENEIYAGMELIKEQANSGLITMSEAKNTLSQRSSIESSLLFPLPQETFTDFFTKMREGMNINALKKLGEINQRAVQFVPLLKNINEKLGKKDYIILKDIQELFDN